MTELPDSEILSIRKFNACFENITNSYKFYWLLAILEELNEGNLKIANSDLALRMISLAWYPLDYFKLSFGKQDSFIKLSEIISSAMGIDQRPNAQTLFKQLSNYPDPLVVSSLKKELLDLLRWVKHRFIRPFFSEQLNGLSDSMVNVEIERLANLNPGFAPYHFQSEYIVVDEKWANYLITHQYILRGFTNWHLLRFLQKHNPNAIGLSEKLSAPISRNLIAAKSYWTGFMEYLPVECIYTGEVLVKENISLDHFIPWSYIAHDQIWNIIPTTRVVNSAKGNALPNLRGTFESFCHLQYSAMVFHLKQIKSNHLEDFHSLLKTEDLTKVTYTQFRTRLFQEISTHHRLASNMGFVGTFG